MTRNAIVAVMLALGWCVPLQAQESDSLSTLSLDSLLNIKVNAASRYAQSTSSAPASIVVITGEDIRRFGYRTLAEVLNDVAGFYISNDRNYTYLGVRGFSRPTDYNDRVLLLLNGQRLNEGFYGSAYIGDDLGVDVRSLERVEIVRGPGSVIYGNNAMFAVINLVTASTSSFSGGRLSGRFASAKDGGVSGQYGGRMGGLDVSASFQVNDRDGEDLYFPEYDDASNNGGVAQNLDWEKFHNAFASLAFKDLQVQLRYARREKGIPTGAWESAFNDSRARTDDRFASMQAVLDRGIAHDKQLQLRARYDSYLYYGWYPYDASDMYTDHNDVRSLGLEGVVTWDLNPRHRLVTGAEANWYAKAFYGAESLGQRYYWADHPFNTYSFFAQSEFDASQAVTAYAGLRYDLYAHSENAVTPRLALIIRPDSANNFKVLFGSAFRAPNVYERMYFSDTQKAAPNIRPETVRTLETVFEHRFSPRLQASAAVFYSSIKDLIDAVEDPADSLTQFTNHRASESKGAEAELVWRSGQNELRASYSYAFAEDEAGDVWLTNSPMHLYKVRATFQLPAGSAFALSSRYESRRKTIYDTRTRNSFIADATLSWRLKSDLDVALQLRNAFDAEFSTPGGFEHRQAAITQDGRSFNVQLDWRF